VIRGRQAGFTLIEVLAALAVLALALSAIIKATGENAVNAAYLRDKTLAHWVAMNRLAEIRLAGAWPDTGGSNGSEEMAGREWFWQLQVQATPNPDMRRLDIDVRYDDSGDESRLVSLSAFMTKRPEK